MTHFDWQKLAHFKSEEFGIPELMDNDFMTRLEAFRVELAIPVYINYSNGKETHEPNSLHYSGKACDVMLERSVTINDFICATRFFSEVGIYPEWTNAKAPNAKGGLHVGFNWSADRTVKQRRYWIGIKADAGNNYIPLTTETLTRFKIA